MTDEGVGVVRPLPGDGLIAHVGGLLLVCDAAGAVAGELLAAVEETVATGGDGRALARRAAQVLARAMTAEPIACALAGRAGDGLAVLVSGDAQAVAAGPGGELRLDGRDALTWTDRMVRGPVSRVELRLPGAGEPFARARLDSGVVAGGGVICDYDTSGAPAGQTIARSPQQSSPAPSGAAPYSSGPSQQNPPAYSSGPSQQNPAPYSSGPSQQNPAPYSSGPSQAGPAPYGSGPPQHAPAPYGSGPSQPAPYQSGPSEPLGRPEHGEYGAPMAPPEREAPRQAPDHRPAPAEPSQGHQGPGEAPRPDYERGPGMLTDPEGAAAPGGQGDPGERAESPGFESFLLIDQGDDGEQESILEPTELGQAPEPPSRPMVYGVDCKNDHFNDPRVPYCAVCGIALVQRTLVPYKGERPPLGVLLLDDGMTLNLETDYLLGRDPERAQEVTSGEARPARVTSPDGSVSRRHLRVRLDSWDVNLIDLGSVNGTQVQPPGDPNFYDIPPNEPVPILPGTTVRIGVSRTMRYESHRNA
ncbi:FHA domain-containing protein [Sphaerisporangium aureirubrum]|uniref:FHA domain-containing protein n=1 Tax=Sphaerisporangium aureirubrum TaxID=1544736 RepID=A0ABW1NKE5_9ACTN